MSFNDIPIAGACHSVLDTESSTWYAVIMRNIHCLLQFNMLMELHNYARLNKF